MPPPTPLNSWGDAVAMAGYPEAPPMPTDLAGWQELERFWQELDRDAERKRQEVEIEGSAGATDSE